MRSKVQSQEAYWTHRTDIDYAVQLPKRKIELMLTISEKTWSGEACPASRPVSWPVETVPEYPQASYYRARYYDQSTGRFLSEDPIGFEGGFNLYEYGEDNPTDLSDPFGWQSTTPPGCSPPFLTPCGPPLYGPPVDTLPPKPAPPPVPGWWPGSGPGSGSGPKPGTAPSPSPLPRPTPATGGKECDNNKGPDCKKATPSQLATAGITDPHEFKKDYLGKKAPISRHDICACKDGSIIIKPQGQCGAPGPGIPTDRTWK
jgi:RHS repeat-associated protein